MSGIVNKTGAVSGVIGTTVGSVTLTGHIINVTAHHSTVGLSQNGNGTSVDSDANDCNVTCTAGNKLHIWISGGQCLAYTGTGAFWFGLRIEESGQSDVDVFPSSLYSRTSGDYKNDSIGIVIYTHTAVTNAAIIKRAIKGVNSTYHGWEAGSATDGAVRYTVLEEQV